MQPSDNLYRLIHSLTKAEKKHFHLLSGDRNRKKTYFKLYTFLANRKEMEEEKMMKLLGMEGKPQSYYNLRNYLFRVLFKSLIQTAEGPDVEISKKIIYAKILIERGIHTQARKIIRPLLDQTRKEERFHYSLQTARLYIQVKRVIGHPLQIDDISGYQKDVLVKLNNWHLYESHFETFQPFMGMFCTFYGSGMAATMEEARKNPLFQSDTLALSARAKRCYWGLHSVAAMMEGDFQVALSHYGQLLTLFKEHPFLKTDHYREYISILLYSGRLQLELGQTKECEATLALVTRLYENNPPQWLRLQIETLELRLTIKSGNREKGMQTLTKLESILPPNPDRLPNDPLIPALYEMAYGYLAFGEPQKALKHTLELEKLLGSSHLRLDLRWATRLLKLIIAIDLDDGDLIEKYYRAAYRFLYCRNLPPAYCSKLIYTVYCINRYPILERKGYFATEIAKLEAILQDQFQARTLIYFDGLAWLRGKCEGKTIAEMNREKLPCKSKTGIQNSPSNPHTKLPLNITQTHNPNQYGYQPK